jgi:GNAT superfamily N-acetyltransferase
MLSIKPLSVWPIPGFEDLVHESRQAGFRFLERLDQEWLSAANRFSKKGEALFAVFDDGKLVAVGGINRQSDDCGRLRHFYVKSTARRRGVGRLLAQHILAFASQHYARVVLRTDTLTGDRFYTTLGFLRLPSGDGPTHVVELKGPDRSAK